MSSLLYGLGRWAFRARWLVISLWIALLAVAGGGALVLNQGTENAFSIPGTQSQAALDTLSRTFPQVSGSSAQVVVVAPEGEQVEQTAVTEPVGAAIDDLEGIDGVAAVTDPFSDAVSNVVSDDGSAAVITVQLEGSADVVGDDLRTSIQSVGDELAAALPEGSEVSVGGEAFAVSLPAVTITEALGVIIALIVLLVTFRSFVAAGLPLLTAILGVGISMAGIFIATVVTSISSTTPLLALMLGLAVGIDYALFIISRHLDQLREGMAPEESAARATATAGSAVIFAGLTVIIALVGLAVANIPFLTTMGVAAAIAVGVAVAIALTMTPALLGASSGRLVRGVEHSAAKREARRARREQAGANARAEAASEHRHATPHRPWGDRFFRGWVRGATRRPALTIVLIVGALGLASVPALDLRLALPDAAAEPEGTSARDTYDLLAERFGEGYNGPLIVTGSIITSTDPLGLMEDLAAEIRELDGVAAVPLATPNATADTGIIQVIPEGAPGSVATQELVHEIRGMSDYLLDEYGVELAVTGFTAVGIDVSERLAGALLPFGLFVVGLSLILLTMVFRSLWVPLKATIGYLLSVGASFGAVAAVFEWGWFADALHVANVGPVISFMPIVLMGVLFGLAMDYEVFLVSRIREDYVHGGDARAAIETGFLGSGKVVTAAAVIMFSVFAAFVPEGDSSIKPIALGLAVGVFVDAFIVRMTLVPAVLQLLGERAWRMPGRLARALPSFDVEGEGLNRQLALADWPSRDTAFAIAADDLELRTRDGLATGIDLRVPEYAALVVQGAHRTGKSALLLTLAGRLAPAGGRLKVGGYLLPERASAVRSRVALVRMAGEPDPVGALRAALAEHPSIVALDDLDHVTDPRTQADLQRLLTEARPSAVLATCVDTPPVGAILPTDLPTVLAVTDTRTREEAEAER